MSEPMDKREEVELPKLPDSVLMRMRNNNNSGHYLESTQEALYGRERQLKVALSANREKDAEIERLKAATLVHNDSAVEAWKLTQQWQKRVFDLEAELASLRASVVEKWINVKQELPLSLKESIEYLVALPSLRKGVPIQTTVAYWIAGADVWQDGLGDTLDGITHWQPLPSPPTKDKE